MSGSRRLCVYNGGLLWPGRIRRMLRLAGYAPRLGLPRAGEAIGVWGASPTAHRGERIAARTGAPLIRIEDAFLRSLHPGRMGEPPLGLLIDDLGVHFNGRAPSRLERLLAEHPLDDTALLDRARAGMERMRHAHLSKYAACDPGLAPPDPGYVLVIDQTRGDASVRAAGGTRASFLEMLFTARDEYPHAPIIVKSHPETARGLRPGHLSAADMPENAQLLDAPLSPWDLLEGAIAVYVFSSQLGFEAILAGHRPVVFGQPFYAGWGLSEDRQPIDRRQRRLTRAQLFAGAMIEAPLWYDPFGARLGRFEDALGALEAAARAWREDRQGWRGHGIRLWKRKHFQSFFGRTKAMRFSGPPRERRSMIWGDGPGPEGAWRIEDGFLRSRGLGAALTPPLSLALDDLGLHYDPSRESRLERLIAERPLSPAEKARAEALIARITRAGLSKYNLGAPPPPLPEGEKILVVGQVADDASIRLAGAGMDNRALLEAARAAHPEAKILWKPHPDVEAGLRPGAAPDWAQYADIILENTDPAQLLPQIDRLWTISSGLGFEALLRGVPVTCLGQPFYAGWGLTTDAAPLPRRAAHRDLARLVHRALIDYPRYLDPVSGLPCPVEIALERLVEGAPARGPALRILAKAQGVLASQSWLWRR